MRCSLVNFSNLLLVTLMYRNLVRKAKLAILEFIVNNFPGFVRAIENRTSLELDHVKIIEHLLSHSKKTAHTLNFLMADSGYPIKFVWVVVDKLSTKQGDVWVSLRDDCSLVESKEIRFFIKVRDRLNRGSPTDVDCNLLIDEYLSLPSENLYRSKKIVSLLSTLILLDAPLKDVEGMLGRLGCSIKNSTEFQKLRFLSRFQNHELLTFEYWYQKLKREFSDAGMLKAQLIRANLIQSQGDIYRELEDGFSLLPHSISRIYRNEIKPIFRALPSDKNYINARFDEKERCEIQKIILDRLRSRSSLSYIRLGDGECYGFVDYQHVDERGELRQEEHWWGVALESSIRSKIKNEFLMAVNKSDILGVPTVLRLIKDFNLEFKGEYPPNTLLARLICVMKASGPFLPNKLIVEDQSNLYFFDYQFIADLFKSAEKIVVMSGIKSDFVCRWALNNAKLSCIELPTHRLLRNGAFGSDIEGILPLEYERYLNFVSENAAPGVLFLVSAGFVGKSFVSKAAEHGAVALDIGQILATEIGSGRSCM